MDAEVFGLLRCRLRNLARHALDLIGNGDSIFSRRAIDLEDCLDVGDDVLHLGGGNVARIKRRIQVLDQARPCSLG